MAVTRSRAGRGLLNLPDVTFRGSRFVSFIKLGVGMVTKSLVMTLMLGQPHFDQCAANLVRKAQTLTYTCELEIPQKSKVSKFEKLLTPPKLSAPFGGTTRDVLVEVSPDAKVLSLTTSFDATGLDLELSKFNDDFFAVYNKAAHSVISDALKKQQIKIEVLESRK